MAKDEEISDVNVPDQQGFGRQDAVFTLDRQRLLLPFFQCSKITTSSFF